MGRKSLAISMTAPLQSLIITVKLVALEEGYLSDPKNQRLVADKHYLLNRDNLTQPLQMQISQK